MSSEPLRFRFASRPLPLVFAVLFFGGATALFGHLFLTSDRPVRILFFLIEGGAAKVFFAGLGICSLGFVTISVWAAIRDLLQPRELVVDDEALHLQLGIFRRTQHTVRIADVHKVGQRQVYSNRFLVIQHAGGTLQFPMGHLPDQAAVKAIVERLHQG